MQKMTFEELERHELEPMESSTFRVCDELTSRIDGASMLNGFWSPKKEVAGKIEQKKTLQIINQTFPSIYDWEELIYSEKIKVVENGATWCKAKNKIQENFLWAQRIFIVKKSLNSKKKTQNFPNTSKTNPSNKSKFPRLPKIPLSYVLNNNFSYTEIYHSLVI